MRNAMFTGRFLLILIVLISDDIFRARSNNHFIYSEATFVPDFGSCRRNFDFVRLNSVPYCILKVDQNGNANEKSRQLEEISEMCIDVFFNEEGGFTSPWKSMQLAYLRQVQYGDLMMRKFTQMRSSQQGKNEMFVIRQVYVNKKGRGGIFRKPSTIVDIADIVNGEDLVVSDEDELVAGQVLAFCEVTAKQFGLGPGDLGYPKLEGSATVRPVITNLAVRANSRKLGLGRKLVETVCNSVQQWKEYDFKEVVLQVEEDNIGGLRFYERLGFETVFADPACRRYDTKGLFLRQMPITKIAMRKELSPIGKESAQKTMFEAPRFFQAIKEVVMGIQ